jgi:DNA-binding transcriptional ArsR family regulator
MNPQQLPWVSPDELQVLVHMRPLRGKSIEQLSTASSKSPEVVTQHLRRLKQAGVVSQGWAEGSETATKYRLRTRWVRITGEVIRL